MPSYSPESLNESACALIGRQEYGEAIILLRKALMIRPDFPEARVNIGKALGDLGDTEAAIEETRRAIALRPDLAEAHWNIALSLLLVGSCEEGWEEYEWREQTHFILMRRFGQRWRWNGEPAPQKTILVHAEQGLGDTLHFLRYLPLARERSGGARIVFECQPELLRVVQSSALEGIDVIARTERLPSFDLQIPLHSIPLALRRFQPETMHGPYLKAAVASRIKPCGKLKVGLVWSGSGENPRNGRRSFNPSILAPILSVEGADFYSLQLGQTAPEGVTDLTPHIADFADTAALMSELDLIITVDTAAAHLAGALGRPVWTLLPFVPDWRWGLEREDTPWYPTMRLFRQKTAGDWSEVIQRVATELKAKIT